jgi:hypothetical protein
MLALAVANGGLRRLAGQGAFAGTLPPAVLGGLREVELRGVRAMRVSSASRLPSSRTARTCCAARGCVPAPTRVQAHQRRSPS